MTTQPTDAFDQATQPPSLRQRLSDAMSLIGYIQKDGEAKHGERYRYLSEEAVKRKVQDALCAYGLVPEPKFTIEAVRELPTSQGRMRLLYDVKCVITIRDGDDSVKADGLGSGIDYADKALMKAQTAAIREAWKNLFCIPSGNDPEADPSADKPDAAPAQQPQQQSKPAQAKPEPKAELDLSAVTEQRQRLELSGPNVMAIARKMFNVNRMVELEQGKVNDLADYLARMDARVAGEVRGGNLNSIPSFEGVSK